ncbi:little elongation complex subunit 1 isoform X3 [Aquila chrysaetos chrysaetos]|uniref:Interactor of little elongation complex ELL subunit 1 n=1 Tax=Aquila chrysaetos chrysaetos TaxID=223781 RepID=A0A663F3C1_AQUCH|nr:little elongation complex subunit 1 isoform X3 [Aquila chrysaetos chrysaetos]
MMPGETPPPPAGTAAAAAGPACANCGVLQQNINEYVAALIALKQKMIDGDRLLTEYQQKCTELQFAEREISALRCQVEQMLQKILPLEKCQEELGSLKAELEEKKSSLKIYRESQLEYVKIKEEIVNSDAVRKKLETKVKKLEEAATKHTQDFRQLKTEKKRLEKELKKAQGKLDGVLKEKCRKVKHAETQSSSEDLTTDIDKEKIKLLLEELWMCIDSATGKRENQENDPVLASIQDKAWPEKRRLTVTEETVQIHQKIRKCDGKTLPWCSSLESAGKQNSLTAMQLQASTEPFGGDCVENRPTEECLRSGEDKTVGVIIQTDGAHSSSDFSDQEQKGPGGNVMDILNWIRPLPALLSPVQLSPPTTQDMLFGEVTGSSDEEVDCSASAVEDILQEDQVQPQSCDVFSHNEEFNRQSKSCQQDLDAEISRNLSWNENNVHIGPKMSSKEERDAETKQAEAAALITNMETNKDCLEENSENMETEKRELTEATADELEAIEEQKGDSEDIHSEEGGSSADFVLHSFKPQNQLEKCSEVAQTEENVILIRAVDYEGTHEEHGEFMKAESNGLSGERETPRAVSVPQNVTHLPPEQCIVLQSEGSEEKSDVLIQNEVVENGSKNVIEVTNTASDVGENIKEVIIGEKITAAIQMKGLCAEANNESELSENVLSDFSSLKSFCEVECSKDLVIQRHGEGIIMETEADTGAIEMSAHSECSEIKHDSEEILEKQCVQTIKDEADRKCEPETVKVSRHYLPVSATEGIRNLLSMDDTDKNVGMERPALSAFPKDDAQLKTEDMNITRPETIELAMKFNRESVLEIAESSEILHSAENGKLVDIKEGGYLKGKPHHEEYGSNSSQGKSDLESILALPRTACITHVERSVAKCESSVLDFTEIEGEIKQPENLCSALECGLSKTQNFRVFESQETEFKVNPEDFEEESNELLERVDTIESVLVESNLTSEAQFAKPLNQFLITENVKCDEIKGELNKQSKELVTETCSTSFNWEENVVKKNNASEIICHSEMDFHSGLAFSVQGDLEMDCINTEETDCPVQVGIGLESTMPPDLNFHLQKAVSFVETDFTEKAAFSHTWENKGDKNCVTGSAFNCSSESLEEGAESLSAEKDNMCKEPDCTEREYVHKNEVKIPSEKKQPVDKEPQAPVKSQILDPNSYNKNTFLQKSECQESGCRTSTWEVGTEPSTTGSLTAGGESKELNSSEPSGKNAIKRSKNDFDMPEQSNESEEKDCSIQKVPMFRKELNASRRIAVGALETGAIVGTDYQGCELPSTMHPGNTLTVSHTKADTVVDMYTRCETNSSPDTANELSNVVGEGYPKDLASWKRKDVLVTSENTEGANECMVDSNRAGCMNDSEESLLKTGTSKESPVMPNASKNRLPLCQTLTRFPETCRLAVKDSKLNSRMLALGNFLEENDSEKLQSNVGQSLLHGVGMGVSVFEEYNHNQTHTASNIGENNTNVILDGSSRKKNCVKCLPNPALSDVECNCQTVRQPPEPQKTVFEKLCMLESESCVDVALKKSNKLKRKEQEPSEILTVSTKTTAQVMHAKLSKRLFQGKRKTKTLKVRQTQPVLANADTSMPTKCLSETINKIRQEMGPPLPPLLLPLIATPPKAACTVSPVMSSTGRSSLLSPLDDLISPLRETPVPPLMSPLRDTPTVKSALLFSPPSPSEMAVGRRICSSPLKFCTSIPKHALPVPGRFPLFAADSAAPGTPQENSVKILDTMYPELSARARTLNILKGNIQLNRCAFSDSQSLPGPVAQIGGFKAIASTSTAFVKTGSNLKSDSSKDQDKDVQNQQLFSSSSNHLEKRTPLPISMPRSAKRLRLDSEPPKLEPNDTAAIGNPKNTISGMQEAFHDKSCEISDSSHSSSLEASLPVKKVIDPDCQKVSSALKKIAESCFDLLPVIKGHVYVGNISKIPIMRDEEKEVVYEFGIKNKHLAESLLHVILNKLKAQKNATNYNFNQALCRVYTGICRQLGDLERARIFCYSLLKEDFPDSEKLILFIINVWSDIFVFQGAINKAMQLVVRQSASNEMLACFSAYLNWEQSSSLDAGIMVSNLLLEMQSCPKVEFQLSEHYGEDLSEDAWQYIFAVDLLCSRLKWDWTHDNVISKVLWPSMDKWVKKRKGHETAQSIPDSVIALTLRLIGRLGQIGLKEGYLAAVKNISSVIGLFVQHAKEEGVPWGVQLAAIYSLCDLGSSNPEGIVEAIHAWRATVLNNIPFAVTSGIAEITSLCKMELN